MQPRRTVTTALPLLLLAILVFRGAWAEPPSFRKLYASDDKEELTTWGQRYVQGEGVPKDHPKAVKLFCKSACRGDANAKFELGRLYTFGEGIKPDWDLVAAWYREAVADGHPEAQAALEVLGSRDERAAACPLYVPGGSYTHFEEVARLARTMAPDYRLDPDLVLALVEAESHFDPEVTSRMGAKGLMQLMPGTVKGNCKIKDVRDPKQNLECGMTYLRKQLDHFKKIDLALAAYNAGPAKVRRFLKGGGKFSNGKVIDNGPRESRPELPDETKKYVEKILGRIGWNCPYGAAWYSQ